MNRGNGVWNDELLEGDSVGLLLVLMILLSEFRVDQFFRNCM